MLFSISMLAGAIRISGISLIDEMAFLLLVILLLLYRKSRKGNSTDIYLNKYFSRASFSFKLLFAYLIFSLLYGLFYDPYFGKLRWLIILAAIITSNSVFLFYLRRRLNETDRVRHLLMIYNYMLAFSVVYISYGLIANYLFNIEPANLQDAEIDALYAIWGTSAYVSIIFLPL